MITANDTVVRVTPAKVAAAPTCEFKCQHTGFVPDIDGTYHRINTRYNTVSVLADAED